MRLGGMSILAWLKIIPTRTAILLLVPLYVNSVFRPNRSCFPKSSVVWVWERQIERDAERFLGPVRIDPARIYSLAELIDFASHTIPRPSRVGTRPRSGGCLGGRPERLYPTLAAARSPHRPRLDSLSKNRFFRQTTQTFLAAFDLNYTVFGFRRRGRPNRRR